MPSAELDGVRIEFETRGDPAGRPLLLIRGLGTQLIHWDDEFLDLIVASGHRAIYFDNRDVGLSSWFDAVGPGSDEPAYALDDMANDAAGLLDQLGIEKAHVLGISLGGMIAQTLAIRQPRRVRSLVSVMSSTGSPALPPPTPEALEALLEEAPSERGAYLEYAVRTERAYAGSGFPYDAEAVRARAARAYDRAFHPDGSKRQLAAVAASGSRVAALAAVRAPSLVIHGRDDPLLSVEAGVDTARAIPHAELLVIDGMGHDLPRGAWQRIVDAISTHTRKA